MIWSKKRFPDALKNLDEEVRKKAIDIGNALVQDENMDEGKAIAIAIKKAKEWAASNNR
jgi:uncharacterized protein YdaT